LRRDQNKFFKQNQTMNTKQNQTINTSKCTYPKAMVSAAWVAELYEKGWGVAQDYGKALEWFQKADDDGNTDTMINLDQLYENGLGI